MPYRVLALEQIRRMQGGAQAQLMHCSDGGYYVVKFSNNPQGIRILANEVLGTLLAGKLGLPVLPIAVVEVCEGLIRRTDNLVMKLGRERIPCQAGLCFGSRFAGDWPSSRPDELNAVYDFLPDEQLINVENISDFLGIFIFDKWTCNGDGRQAVFTRGEGRPHYRAAMIDNGFCFNAGEWNFPDSPHSSLYPRPIVYRGVSGIESFEPWLSRLERAIDFGAICGIAESIPPEWYGSDRDRLMGLLDRLDRRRARVRDLVWSAARLTPVAFPAWARPENRGATR